MAVQDLREWIARVDEIGELSTIDGADAATEIGGIVDLHMQDAGNPAVLFDRIVGHPAGHRLIANVLTSYPRVALTLGLSPELGPRELVLACRVQSRNLAPIAAETVEWGPVLEHQARDAAVDTTKFPAPILHAGDGGRYVGTGCIVVMREPDSGWVNAQRGPGAGWLGMDQRRAVGKCFEGVEDRRQLLVVEFDQIKRGLGNVEVVGHDGGNGIADEAGFVHRQDALVAEHRPEIRKEVLTVTQISASQDQLHAGHVFGLPGVDPANAGVGEAAAQDSRVEHAG